MEFVGAIDAPQQDRIAGWAVTRFGDACEVTVIVNGTGKFKAASDGPRPDLAAKQQSRGAGGFRIDIAPALKPGINTIEVQFPDGSHVPGSPYVRRIAADWVPATHAAIAVVLRAAPRLSASELEDISLDDVGFAVAHGVIDVPIRPRQPVPERSAAAAPAADHGEVPRAGWLARWFPRRAPRAA